MYEALVRINAAQLHMLVGEDAEGHQVFEDETSQFLSALLEQSRHR